MSYPACNEGKILPEIRETRGDWGYRKDWRRFYDTGLQPYAQAGLAGLVPQYKNGAGLGQASIKEKGVTKALPKSVFSALSTFAISPGSSRAGSEDSGDLVIIDPGVALKDTPCFAGPPAGLMPIKSLGGWKAGRPWLPASGLNAHKGPRWSEGGASLASRQRA
ncbi:MAG: hypothetical protein LBU25_03850 [Treponema sp.]|nr:hypothetical protein [Treponema sp.]